MGMLLRPRRLLWSLGLFGSHVRGVRVALLCCYEHAVAGSSIMRLLIPMTDFRITRAPLVLEAGRPGAGHSLDVLR